MQRKASAQWQGDLKTGKGNISTESGVLSKTQYSFSTRFENGVGTNPEELIGAAHAGCFSMALSGQLGGAGMTAESIDTTATVTMEKLDVGFTVTKVHWTFTRRSRVPTPQLLKPLPIAPRKDVPFPGCSKPPLRWMRS